MTTDMYQIDALTPSGKMLRLVVGKDNRDVNVEFLKRRGYEYVTVTQIV